MISTSTTISARGLSFCWISFSKMPTTGAVARIVIEFCALFGAIAGWTQMPGGAERLAEHLRDLGRVAVRQVERLDDLVVVLRCFCAVSSKTRIDRSLSTLYDSWLTLRIWFSACSSVTPSSCTV